MKNPDYIDHHEGIGMWIRNIYIYGKDLPILFPVIADDLSAIIFEEVIDRLKTGWTRKGESGYAG